MYILDTDTLTLVTRNHAKVLAKRAQVSEKDIAITIITRIELLRGRFDFVFKAADGAQLRLAIGLLDRTERLLAAISNVMTVNDSAAAEFDRLLAVKGLRKIGRGDLLIASIALAHQATLVTRNLRDFRQVPRLQLEHRAD